MDWAHGALAAAGIEPVVCSPEPIDELLPALKKGEADAVIASHTASANTLRVVDFSEPYYFTPAQMTATKASGITSLDGLAGKTVCVGTATTYQDWLQGKLQSVSLGPVLTPPAGVKVQTLDTDQACAQACARRNQNLCGLGNTFHCPKGCPA